MTITIQQTKSNIENKFEIKCGDEVLYYAKAPWMGISAPFISEDFRKLVFTDLNGKQIYYTEYNILDNISELALPFKYLFSRSQKLCKYDVMGQNGKEGSFFTLVSGLLDSKLCFEYGGKIFTGYTTKNGRFSAVSIYNDEDIQIAQITKPLAVIDNLDIYYLHIIDEFGFLLPVLSFITVYYDYVNYSNSGKAKKGYTEVTYKVTYGVNDAKYDPDWIAKQFGREVSDALNQEIQTRWISASEKVRRIFKVIGICFLIGISVAAVITFFVLRKCGIL